MKFVIFITLCFVSCCNSECIEGEYWFTKCHYCECVDKKPACKPTKCIKEVCIPKTTIFGDDYKCHCTKNKQLICVNLEYQSNLNNKTCIENSYFYNTNNFCHCLNGLTTCLELKGLSTTSTGFCEEGDRRIENCYECTCTKTMFRICVPNKQCYDSTNQKPGRCVIVERFYNPMERFLCIRTRKQECYSDFGCPKNLKCCLVTDCFYRCMEPNLTYDIFD